MENLAAKQNREEFLRIFSEVTSPELTINPCGRDRCIDLILACRKIDPSHDYGDSNNGFIDFSEILQLYHKLS